MPLVDLKNLTFEELRFFIKELGEPQYRAEQIFQWMHKGVIDFNNMTNLPHKFIKKLSQKAFVSDIKILKRYKSEIDNTVKYVFLLNDNNLIEGVKMNYSFGSSACISTQVGCQMGCYFCASTKGGFVRNLTCAEMLNEILVMEKDTGQRISRIVLMGMGEPLLNYDEVLKFIKLVNSPKGLDISYRRITLSTCGIVPKIKKLAEENLPITLAISLHAADDELRNQLMPINHQYPISQLLDVCKYYIIKTNRRITFEYTLIEGVNDKPSDAVKLAKMLKDMLAHVNLIPLNPIKEKTLKRSDKDRVEEFAKVLKRNNIPVTIRREMGLDINAACGQLRQRMLMR